MQDIHFFSVCDVPYYDFILPFFYSTLKMNEGSTAEVVVDDIDKWNKSFKKQIDFLNKYFKDRWLVRANRAEFYKTKKTKHSAATYRFLEIPTTKRELTYIADIDILFTTPNVYDYEKNLMTKHNFNFNNFLRKRAKRFTGCFCVKTEDYYKAITPNINAFFKNPKPFVSNGWGDEMVLHQLLTKSMSCPKSTVMLYDGFHIRKIHGVHVSPNREINGNPGWGFNKDVRSQYRHLKRQPEWDDFLDSITNNYKVKVINLLEMHLP